MTITLISSDEVELPVELEVIKQSKIVSDMLEHLSPETEDTPIPITNVTSAILKKIIEWCTYVLYHNTLI